MAELTNHALMKFQFKMVDYTAQICKDRLHNMKQSMIVIQKDNLSEQEFKDFTAEIVADLKKKYVVKKCSLKVTKVHEIYIVEDEVVLPD